MEQQTKSTTEPDELAELVEAMTPIQKLSFKQAVVRQSIYYVSKKLPPEEQDDGHRDGIWAATNWLNEPTDKKASDATIYAAGSCWDGGVRYHDYTADFLDPAWTAGELDAYKAANLAMRSAPKEEQGAARQWQISCARAILQNEKPPQLM